jgi:hypothetical protein
MLRVRWLAVAALLLLAVAGCGGDDGNGGETTAAADLDRYCELTQQLDQAGTEAFRELEQDPEATREDFEQAEADFVREHDAELDEIVEVAPAEIQDEIQVVIAATRGRAGLEEQPPAKQDERVAERTVQRFERENCEASGGN